MKNDLRLNGWEMRLDALLYSRRRTPFQWGIHDCALFAADAVLAVTGLDHAAELRGKGSRESLRFTAGQGGLCAIATRALGQPQPASDAREGDIVLMPAGRRVGLSVCMTEKLVVGAAPVGLAWMPLRDGLFSWRVG